MKMSVKKMSVKKIGVLVIATIFLFSCSKDTDPADSDLFVGAYDGSISYLADGETKSTDDGSVTVVKVGNDYNFLFSDGIPDLTGVKFRTDGDNAVISIDDDEAKYIRITANSLIIAYTKDGAIWTADCDR